MSTALCQINKTQMSKNNTISIKNNWEELTLDEVTTISSILSADVPEEMKTIEVIAVLTGKDRNEIENLPIFIFRKLANRLDFLNNPPEQAKLHNEVVYNTIILISLFITFFSFICIK